MPLSRRRASAPERVPEPQAECALIFPCLAGGGDSLGEVGGDILALENCLPGDARRISGLPESASLAEFR